MELNFVVIVLLLGWLKDSNGATFSTCTFSPQRIEVNETESIINVYLTSYRYRYSSATCKWLLQNVGCGGLVITATLTDGYNTASFYDGSSTTSTRLHGYTVTSTGDNMLISANLRRRRRLMITFKTAKKVTVAEFSPQSLSSVGFPNQEYENNLRCSWEIVTRDTYYSIIKITVLALELETDYDYLRIYDGSVFEEPTVMYTGNVSQEVFYSTGSKVVVVFTSDKQNTGKGFKLTYQKVVAVPSISKAAHQISEGKQEKLSVSFVSVTPHLSVYWQKNDDPLVADTRYHMQTTRSDSYTKGYYEYETTLSIDHVTGDDYGDYLVSMENSAGFAEHSLTLQQPLSAAEFGSPVTETADATKIAVTFACSPEYTDVQWWKGDRLIQSDSQDRDQTQKYVMDVKADGSHYTTQLTINSPNITDYGWYKVSVTNKAGTSELKVDLQVPQKFLPVISESYYTTVDEFTGDITFDVLSDLPIIVSWERDSDFLTRNANLSHTLKEDGKYGVAMEISQLSLQDFGAYKLSVQNEAGTTQSKITLKKPEVFPSVLTCNQSKSINITCIVEDCDTQFYPWVHMVSGTVVRRLSGTVNGNTNTLSINRCGFKDAGTYVCQTEEENKSGTVTIKTGHSARLTVNAVPFISPNTSTTITRRSITIEVPVVSRPPLREVYLFKKGRNGFDLGWNEIQHHSEIGINIHEHEVRMNGSTITVSKRNPAETDFGTYHIGMVNDVGYSNFSVEVENPAEDVPSIREVSVSVDESDSMGAIIVEFESFPEYESVVWERNNTTLSAGNKYVVVTSVSEGSYGDIRRYLSNTRHLYSSQLNITDLKVEDYTTYTVTVKNAKGAASIQTILPNPAHVLPKFLDKDVQLIDDSTTKTASLSFNFVSKPTYSTLEWRRDGGSVDSQRYSIVTEALDTDVQQTVYKSTLSIRDPTVGDEGNYTLAVTNKMGTSMESLVLNDCTDVDESS